MKIIARIVVAGLLLTGLSFAKHPDRNWRGDNRSYYRDYNGSYPYSQTYRGNSASRDYRYRDYKYRNSYRVPPGLQNRRYQDLPPGIQRKLRREAAGQRYDYWRGW